jgi:hypothetical protein
MLNYTDGIKYTIDILLTYPYSEGTVRATIFVSLVKKKEYGEMHSKEIEGFILKGGNLEFEIIHASGRNQTNSSIQSNASCQFSHLLYCHILLFIFFQFFHIEAVKISTDTIETLFLKL